MNETIEEDKKTILDLNKENNQLKGEISSLTSAIKLYIQTAERYIPLNGKGLFGSQLPRDYLNAKSAVTQILKISSTPSSSIFGNISTGNSGFFGKAAEAKQGFF